MRDAFLAFFVVCAIAAGLGAIGTSIWIIESRSGERKKPVHVTIGLAFLTAIATAVAAGIG